MKVLQQIIGTMNKEEIRHFKLFINRTNAAPDRKDAQLFDYIRRSWPKYNEEKILQKLYGIDEKNALYRLKNRLLEDIGKSIVLQYFDDSEYNYVLNNIALSRFFQGKGQARIAFHYLTRAGKKATDIESFELLDLIYNEFIRLSHETLEINPEEYIEKRKENRIKLNRLQEIDDILAAVIYRVKTSQNFSRQDSKIMEVLQRTVNDFASREVKTSPQLRFKIYHSLSRILLQQHDYISLEKYLLETFDEFTAEKLFNKNNHDTKLQMLTYLVNSLFKNGKYDAALQYAEKLKKAMNEHGSALHDKYLFYYYNSLVISYAGKGEFDKAIDILDEARESDVIRKLPMYMVFIYLNLAALNFDKKNYKAALKNLVKLSMHDSFNNLDEAFRFKINIVELIIRYELGDFDFVERRIEQVRKEFAHLLNTREYWREKDLLGIIMEMMNSTSIRSNKDLAAKMKKLAGTEGYDEGDIIKYRDWLKGKL
jgi:pentatricopeptide repeat protein